MRNYHNVVKWSKCTHQIKFKEACTCFSLGHEKAKKHIRPFMNIILKTLKQKHRINKLVSTYVVSWVKLITL
jgi:type IV secretory pathway TrbF-like protein